MIIIPDYPLRNRYLTTSSYRSYEYLLFRSWMPKYTVPGTFTYMGYIDRIIF